MTLYNNFFINPESFRIPQYYISPFSTEWISKNNALLQTPAPAEHLPEQLWGTHYYTDSGKTAITKVLKQYDLSAGDEVFIATTTGNTYISSCVTKEIEKYCSWNRELTDRTKLIFVNHEFGTPHKDMEQLVQTGLPIVEDRAMSMFSADEAGKTGRYGDFTIYSLPKFFPVQAGGVIQVNNPAALRTPFTRNSAMEDLLKKLLPHYLSDVRNVAARRWENYDLFSTLLEPLGFGPELALSRERDVPSVYMFHAADTNLAGLKAFMQDNGIECSIFYGRQAFFIPVHQYLTAADITFIVSLIQYFCSNEAK